MNSIEKHIFELENELLSVDTRLSPERISELLAEDFFEFCSSGVIYHYHKGDKFDSENNINEVRWEIKDFRIKVLSEDIALATYRTIKHSSTDDAVIVSLRSSIWKSINGRWRVIFHQGTPSI